jgi:hypothetical protein
VPFKVAPVVVMVAAAFVVAVGTLIFVSEKLILLAAPLALAVTV